MTSLLTLPPKAATTLRRRRKRTRSPERIGPRSSTISPSQQITDKPFIIDGVKYWWCLALNKWVKHAPHECTAKDKKTSNTSGNSSGARNGATIEATMALLEDVQE